MNNKSQFCKDFNYILSIPEKMLDDIRLKNQFRFIVLFYELMRLSKGNAFTTVSNDQLSEMMGVSSRTIYRDLDLLEECGYIRRETVKVDFRTLRHIYVGYLSS